MLWCLTPLSTTCQIYHGGHVSYFGEGNWCKRIRSPSCWKALANFITYCCIEYTSPWAGFELTTLVLIGTDCRVVVLSYNRLVRKDMDVNDTLTQTNVKPWRLYCCSTLTLNSSITGIAHTLILVWNVPYSAVELYCLLLSINPTFAHLCHLMFLMYILLFSRYRATNTVFIPLLLF